MLIKEDVFFSRKYIFFLKLKKTIKKAEIFLGVGNRTEEKTEKCTSD